MTALRARHTGFGVVALALATVTGAIVLTPTSLSAACGRGAALGPTGASTELDQTARRWGVFCDPPGSRPRFELRNVGTPSLDGKALECSYRGGTRYTAAHCYRNLRPSSGVTSLRLSLAFRFSKTTCNNATAPSNIQALEFTASRWSGSRRAELAVQYEIVGEGAPQWRVWDGEAWKTPRTPITGCLSSDRWHRLALEGRLVDGRVRYDALTVDSRRSPLTEIFSQTADRSKARLAVAVQADGNAASTPYRFWIDRVALTVR